MSENLPEKVSVANLISSGSEFVSTLDLTTSEGKKIAFDAINNAESLQEHLGEVIELSNLIAHVTDVVSEETGETVPVERTILVDTKGVCYASVSKVVFESARNLLAIFGMPSEWPEPLKVIAEEQKSKRGRHFMTLKLAK